MSATKTMVSPYTGKEYVIFECPTCGGTGKYWRPDIFGWENCHRCEGMGGMTMEAMNQRIPQPERFTDIPYVGTKGIK